MRIAVAGPGMAGATLACLLADDGPEIVVLEQAADLRPVGAGIWLQQMGQQVLDRLGLLTALRDRSTVVSRVDIRTATGRRLLDLGYADVPGEVPALGVHRGTLFSLLSEEVGRRRVPVDPGVRVTGVSPTASGMLVETVTDDGEPGRRVVDLVVGCDGSRSSVRRSMGVTVRDHPYGYGALWSIVDDPEGLAGGELYQCLRGTREYLGVLPTGVGQASVFWSVRVPGAVAAAADLTRWRSEAAGLAGHLLPLVERVDHLLPATYRDVVVRRPYRTAGATAGAVLVGDAAHAMSPQLGTGTSLALGRVSQLEVDACVVQARDGEAPARRQTGRLSSVRQRCQRVIWAAQAPPGVGRHARADAWTLHHALTTRGRRPEDLGVALPAYAAARAAHVRWYQWWTRLMMPVFQSSLTPLAWPRDALAPWVSRVPGVTPQLVTTLTGDRVSPWSRWELPG